MSWAQTVFEAAPLLPFLPSSSHANQGSVLPPLPALCLGKAGAGRPLLEVTQVQGRVEAAAVPGGRRRRRGGGGEMGLRGSGSASHLSQHPRTRSDVRAAGAGTFALLIWKAN